MSTQSPPLIITSSPKAIYVTTIPIKEKKSRKPKILGTSAIKEVVAEAKSPAINDLGDDLADVVGFMFF